MASGTDDCLDDADVLAFVERRLDEPGRARVEAHLDRCARCRSLVAEAARAVYSDDRDGGTPSEGPTRGAGGRPAPVALAPGTLVGRYQLVAPLGAGGAGVVYRAYDPQLERLVALKLLGQAGDPRLLHEARAMARLSHPNVVPVHDAGVATIARGDGAGDEQVFLVMELIEGETLARWLRARRRPADEILATFVAAGQGLAAAHAAHLVHRDFKPENVLVGRDGRPRVTDFGLARPTAETGPAIASGAGGLRPSEPIAGGFGDPLRVPETIAGTPGYMAPEQLAGAAADARTDQFSFCVALYRALYGRHPYTGEESPSPAALATALASGEPRAPEPRADLRPAVVAALLRGLARQPERRWPSLDALLPVLAGGTARNRRRAAATAAALVGAFAVAAAARMAMGPRCGDGVVQAGEECDDSNARADDACLPTCKRARCGDGVVRTHVEECDDGNARDGDGCSAGCLRCAGPGSFLWPKDGHCYERHDETLSWQAARAECAAGAADLISYTGTADAREVYAALIAPTPADLWIGLRRRAPGDPLSTSSIDPVATDPDRFHWADGQPLQYLWWAEGEPRDGHFCAYQSPGRIVHDTGGLVVPGGGWVSAVCDQRRPFLCEKAPWAVRPAGGHAYRLITQPLSWDEARARCSELGAHLVTIGDADEQAFVAALSSQTFWIGASDSAVEGRFEWVTREPFGYRAFAPNEPDDISGRYDCLAVGLDRGWHDRMCRDRYAAVCEVD
jgi:cysteine-rich repeat protein